MLFLSTRWCLFKVTSLQEDLLCIFLKPLYTIGSIWSLGVTALTLHTRTRDAQVIFLVWFGTVRFGQQNFFRTIGSGRITKPQFGRSLESNWNFWVGCGRQISLGCSKNLGYYPAALSCHCNSVLCGWVCLSLHRECHNSTESWAETWYLKRASKLEQYMRHASEHLLLCTLDGNKLFYLDLLDSDRV